MTLSAAAVAVRVQQGVLVTPQQSQGLVKLALQKVEAQMEHTYGFNKDRVYRRTKMLQQEVMVVELVP